MYIIGDIIDWGDGTVETIEVWYSGFQHSYSDGIESHIIKYYHKNNTHISLYIRYNDGKYVLPYAFSDYVDFNLWINSKYTNVKDVSISKNSNCSIHGVLSMDNDLFIVIPRGSESIVSNNEHTFYKGISVPHVLYEEGNVVDYIPDGAFTYLSIPRLVIPTNIKRIEGGYGTFGYSSI